MKHTARVSRLVRAELHTHSTESDGEYEAIVLAELCVRRQVQVWSLTDHDTVAGCQAAREVAEHRGVRFIDGIEVSAAMCGRSVHVLGYGVNIHDPQFLDILAKRRLLRSTRMERMVERAQDMGFAVHIEDVKRIAKGGNLARPHLAQALVNAKVVPNMRQAFDRYLGDSKPLYVASPWPDVPKAIAEIHAAGGIAVLAHPGIYGLDAYIPEWVESGLDGIEVDHPEHDANAVARYLLMANNLGLLKTKSSDFHGHSVKSGQVLGESFVDRRWVNALLERVA